MSCRRKSSSHRSSRRHCRRSYPVVETVEPLPSYDPNFDVYCGEAYGCVAGAGHGAPWAVETQLPLPDPVSEYWYRMSTLGPYVLPYPGCPGYGNPYFRGAPCGPPYGPHNPYNPYGYPHHHDHHGHHDCPNCNVKVIINKDGTVEEEPVE